MPRPQPFALTALLVLTLTACADEPATTAPAPIPEEQRGSIVVYVKPSDADVTLQDAKRIIETKSHVIENVYAGNVKITVRRSGYRTVTGTVLVEATAYKTTQVGVELKPESPTNG